MPKFHVIEYRSYKVGYLIEAETEAEARELKGDIQDENETDSWSETISSVEKVDDDAVFAPEV